jgi:hypothetical protein
MIAVATATLLAASMAVSLGIQPAGASSGSNWPYVFPGTATSTPLTSDPAGGVTANSVSFNAQLSPTGTVDWNDTAANPTYFDHLPVYDDAGNAYYTRCNVSCTVEKHGPTGQLIWPTDGTSNLGAITGNPIALSPDGVVYAYTTDRRLIGLNAATGAPAFAPVTVSDNAPSDRKILYPYPGAVALVTNSQIAYYTAQGNLVATYSIPNTHAAATSAGDGSVEIASASCSTQSISLERVTPSGVQWSKTIPGPACTGNDNPAALALGALPDGDTAVAYNGDGTIPPTVTVLSPDGSVRWANALPLASGTTSNTYSDLQLAVDTSGNTVVGLNTTWRCQNGTDTCWAVQAFTYTASGAPLIPPIDLQVPDPNPVSYGNPLSGMAIGPGRIYLASSHFTGGQYSAGPADYEINEVDGPGIGPVFPEGKNWPTGGPPPCTEAPNPPQNVGNSADANRGVTVHWDDSAPNCAVIDHYAIHSTTINPDHSVTVGPVVATIPAGKTLLFDNHYDTGPLALCTFYQYGISAVTASGQESSVVLPSTSVFTQGLPDQSPKVVTILALGVKTKIASGSFNPLNVNDYCTTLNGLTLQSWPAAQAPLADITSDWINAGDAHMAPYGADSNLIDAAASGGGIVLPFSYSGAALESGPVFKFTGYSDSTVANTFPPDAAATMNKEITSIHAVWPNARIVVVGHSNGGLIAEQWWLRFGAKNPSGVTQVFSLDSPLNGERSTCGACQWMAGVGKPLAGFYNFLWQHQVQVDKTAVALDNPQTGLFTAIGSTGDPIYDAADHATRDAYNHIGETSQFFYPSACAGSASTPSCLPTGRWYKDPCSPFSDGGPPLYGLSVLPGTGDGWMHSVVKNCVTGKIMQYIYPGNGISAP